MKKLITLIKDTNQLCFWCPGCKCAHYIDRSWNLTGTDDRPTVTPSILVKSVNSHKDWEKDDNGEYTVGPDGRYLGAKDTICHLFIKMGMIQFLSDCTHELAGTTVPMEKI